MTIFGLFVALPDVFAVTEYIWKPFCALLFFMLLVQHLTDVVFCDNRSLDQIVGTQQKFISNLKNLSDENRLSS